ncbi:MAG: hypothetical protein HQL24_04330 [Candidatus Omnitrophica bacterium]|nr:hypothetical protein [Candidatus Omnitrophota bacterium]
MKKIIIIMLLGLLVVPTAWAADLKTQTSTTKPALHSHKGKGNHQHRQHNQIKTKKTKQKKNVVDQGAGE